MKFYSPDFQDKSLIPAVFTADGENICPDFYISDVPEGTESLAVVCHDPDATAGIPWVHWFAWNIPAGTQSIIKGILPDGSIEGTSSFGAKGYGGPSPSPGSGQHRYVFTLYALAGGIDIDTEKKISHLEILDLLKPKTVESTDWTGIYQRP